MILNRKEISSAVTEKMERTANSSPKVSVVMPVYNVAPYVERCLLPVIRQTFPPAECIIIDDASTDDSVARCERLIANYDGPTKFIIIHYSHNRGLSGARNTGTNPTNGEHFGCVLQMITDNHKRKKI